MPRKTRLDLEIEKIDQKLALLNALRDVLLSVKGGGEKPATERPKKRRAVHGTIGELRSLEEQQREN